MQGAPTGLSWVCVSRLRLSIVLLAVAIYGIAAPAGNAADGGATAPAQTLKNFVPRTVPAPLPEIQFQDADGRLHNLAEFGGKVVLVNFWATWCAPCREEMPSLDRLQSAMGGDDFTVVIVSLDRAGYSKAAAFLDEIGVKNLTTFVDPKLKAARAIGALGLPVTVLLNRKGDEVGRLTGPAEWDSPAAQALIARYVNRTGAVLE